MTFEITPVAAPVAQAQAGEFIQFQNDGTALGAPTVTVVNFTGTGIEATRGVGESANVITVRITPPAVNFEDVFVGDPEALYLHSPQVAPEGFAWTDNSPSPNLLLDGNNNLMNPDAAGVSGAGPILLPMSSSYSVRLDATMDGSGSTDSVSGVSVTLSDFLSSSTLKLIIERVFGGTYNVIFQSAFSNDTVLDVAAEGLHIFVVVVTPTGCDVQMDDVSILTVTGDANIHTTNDITLTIFNTDAGRNHTIRRVAVTQG
jgi:hypothetical protein